MRLPVAAAFTLIATAALAVELPPRKAGMWELKMSVEGRNMPAQSFQHCIDAETDKKMNAMAGDMGADCSKQDVQRVGNTVTVDSVCNIAGATTTSRAVASGDFNSGYTVKVTSKREGGPAGPGMPETNMTIEAKWTGPCKADQRPGDMILGNGMKMNINDMPKGWPGGMKK